MGRLCGKTSCCRKKVPILSMAVPPWSHLKVLILIHVEKLILLPSLWRADNYFYMRLLIFLLAILIAACASSSPAFLMMYSSYKLNKQGDNIQPWCTPFLTWNQSVVPCPVLNASWRAYRFLRRQVRWSGIPISKNFPEFIVIHTVKSFGIVNKAEIDVLLELLIFQWSSTCWQFDLWFLCLF